MREGCRRYDSLGVLCNYRKFKLRVLQLTQVNESCISPLTLTKGVKMRGLILVVGYLIGMANAFAEIPKKLEGRYTSAEYDGPYSYQNAWVEIRKAGQNGLELVFNVPCGTKLTPRVFKIIHTNSIGSELELIEEGSSQCYTGSNPRIILLGDTLRIHTSPRVRTPGFDGTYELSKERFE